MAATVTALPDWCAWATLTHARAVSPEGGTVDSGIAAARDPEGCPDESLLWSTESIAALVLSNGLVRLSMSRWHPYLGGLSHEMASKSFRACSFESIRGPEGCPDIDFPMFSMFCSLSASK